MTETAAAVVTHEMMVSAATNEWGKTFTLGEETFEIKDLGYFDYLEFITLAKPIIETAVSGLSMKNKDGEIDVEFDPSALDINVLIKMCQKELPRLAWLVCKQSQPSIKAEEVANLARRPQRLLEVVLMQILHNKMIEEFASFFTRLTAMVNVLMPDVAKAAMPSELTTEETPSS